MIHQWRKLTVDWTQWTQSSTWQPCTSEPADCTALVAWYVVSEERPEQEPPPVFPLPPLKVKVFITTLLPRRKFKLLRDAGWRYRQRVKPCGRKYLCHHAS